MLTLLLWGGVIIAIIYYLFIRPYGYWMERGVKQAELPTLHWDNWSAFFRLESFADFDKRIYSRFKHLRYSGIYQFAVPSLVLHDPELIKQITVKDFDHFTDHQNFVPEHTDPLWEKNLFALRGQKWKDMRPILSPSFTSSKMRTIFVLMRESVQNFVKHFSAKGEDVVKVEMKEVLSRLANDIIATTAFGVQVDSFAHPNNDFYLMGKRVANFTGLWTNVKFFLMFTLPKLSQYLNLGLFSKDVRKFFSNLIEETIKTREEKNIVRQDMVHLLMEARKGKSKQEENGVIDTGFATVQEADLEKVNGAVKRTEISIMDIAAQVMVFFLAGFDSVTNLMCFLAYELAVNPDIQDRLREEIHETQSACKGNLTYEALMQMKYMDMVVSECLRKWPNNIMTDRVCTKPYTIKPTRPNERPVEIEVGTGIWIPMYGIHHDPQYYPNPEKFDPERFNEENRSRINPYAYYPFGLGPRNCIGSRFALMEVKTLYYYLLMSFELVPTEKTPIPAVISKKSFTVTLAGGFHVGLKKIKSIE